MYFVLFSGIFSINLMGEPIVVVCDEESVRDVLVNQSHAFAGTLWMSGGQRNGQRVKGPKELPF